MKSEEDFIIDTIDLMISKAPVNTAFNPSEKLIGYNFDNKLYQLSAENEVLASMHRYEFVIKYAIEKGYIIHPKDNTSSSMFALTEMGKDVKYRGGIGEYLKFYREKDNAIFEQIRLAGESVSISREAANAAKESATYSKKTMQWIAVYTIITIIIAITSIATCTYTKRNQSIQSNAPNSTKEATVRSDTDMIK